MARETGVQSQVESYQRFKNGTQHYKVRINGKVEQSKEWSSAFPYTLGVVAIEKESFGSLSTKVDNFTFTYNWKETVNQILSECRKLAKTQKKYKQFIGNYTRNNNWPHWQIECTQTSVCSLHMKRIKSGT